MLFFLYEMDLFFFDFVIQVVHLYYKIKFTKTIFARIQINGFIQNNE